MLVCNPGFYLLTSKVRIFYVRNLYLINNVEDIVVFLGYCLIRIIPYMSFSRNAQFTYAETPIKITGFQNYKH